MFGYQHHGIDALVLRTERPEDVHAVTLAHIAAWRSGYAGILPDDTLAEAAQPTASYVERWAQRRRRQLASADPAPETLVAEADSVVIGHITYGQGSANPVTAIGQLWSCYVHPDYWGTGVADALLRAALNALSYPDPAVGAR